MKARIFKPARTAMQQSGQENNHPWVIEFAREAQLFIEPLMGWTGTTDNTQQLRLRYATKEEAIEYAQRNGLEYEVKEPRARTVKPKSYAANFAFNRVSDATDTSN